jgi:hypothetical protein
MYTDINFKTKKALKEAVNLYNEWISKGCGQVAPCMSKPQVVTIYAPGLGTPKQDGDEYLEGPHYPEPHRWHAEVEMKDGVVVKVK